MIKGKTVFAIPPGATIKEQLVDRGMSQKEFAIRMALSEKHVSKLINGEVQLTGEVALRLEMVLGLPAHFWNNLENIYRENLIKANAELDMESDINLAKKIPYKKMAENGWIVYTEDKHERIEHLRKYFEVVKLGLLTNPAISNVAYRKQIKNGKDDFAVLAWIQKSKLEGRNISTDPIDLEKLNQLIPKIQKLVLKRTKTRFEKMKELFSSCGIALVILPYIGETILHGASFIDGSKIIMAFTIAETESTDFAFSLFHELGHIVLGHVEKDGPLSKADEAAADSFAKSLM